MPIRCVLCGADARVPLIIHHPLKPKTWGTRQPAIVEHVDLYPTITALCGLPDPLAAGEAIQGTSYAALFDNAVLTEAEAEAFSNAYTQ